MFSKRKEHLLVYGEGNGFPSWPFFSSLLLHGLMAYWLITWTFPQVSESVSRVVMVRIVEEKKEKIPLPPTPIRPKPKKAQEFVRPKPGPPPIVLPKKEDLPSVPIFQAAEQRIPQVLQLSEANLDAEEKIKEKWMEKTEPGRWGTPEGSQDAGLPGPARGEAPLRLTADPGSAKSGVPEGLDAGSPWRRGTGGEGEAGLPAGVGETKGENPAKGAKTGGVYIEGPGTGRGDLDSYLGYARMKIEKAKRYPREARRRGWEGIVVLSFQINRKGEVAKIRLIQSSGYHELDEEGMAILRRASPFSPPPLAEDERLEVEIPLVFRLEERR
jgi:TonB family protein